MEAGNKSTGLWLEWDRFTSRKLGIPGLIR